MIPFVSSQRNASYIKGGDHLQTNVYLVRHAHSTYTADELGRPLSEKGIVASENVRRLFANKKIDAVLSSPYKRAIQTVECVAAGIGKEVIIKEGFKERRLSVKPMEDFQAAIAKVWEDPTFFWEGGESNVAAQKRGVQALLNVLEEYEGKSIVIGTHGNIMVLLMNFFNRNYDFLFWKSLGMPDIYELVFQGKNLINVERI
ncbi:histidine phosphatase family protein [Shouchella clausii]|uniref:Phosphoglycerate mutase n=1 Tax=Shouchella clausii (strain KSM-K16) TaxID=66692 RepID=Q5WI39_SHOC1|nr:Phosphoglycerate mutase family 2 [Shouchella clausii]PAD46849.1 histidine phosphatase family protein [Shouchella clausii]PAE83949.1 histidine phosphatase family protein [Shouchella clausii]BAD63966.1 phosphoglycerate mutase [Shouchella clausii KSM-K16]